MFKEVEKMAVQKGITLTTVKEVVQSLVDEDLVHQETIGASTYYWAFPSEASTKIENEVADLTQRIEELKIKRAAVAEAIEEEKKRQEASQVRANMLTNMHNLQGNLKKLGAELERYSDNDPKKSSAEEEAKEVAKEAAKRWLHNLYSLHEWCKTQFQGREDEIDVYFRENGLTDELDSKQ